GFGSGTASRSVGNRKWLRYRRGAESTRHPVTAALLQQHVLYGTAGRDHRQHVLGVGHDDVEDERSVAIEHLLDGGTQLALEMYAAPLHAEALGDLHEVGIEAREIVGAADVRLIPEDRVAAHAAVEAILP